MLSNELPELINPEKLCRGAPLGGTRLFGKIPLSKLKNLINELKTQQSNKVVVSLVFSVDEEGFCCVEGKIEVELTLICQRCLGPMPYTVRSTLMVSPVVSDAEAKNLPSCYEPLLVNNSEIALSEWIAEELYLALPLATCHETPCVEYGEGAIKNN